MKKAVRRWKKKKEMTTTAAVHKTFEILNYTPVSYSYTVSYAEFLEHAEAEDSDEYSAGLEARERNLHNEFERQIDKNSDVRKQMVGVLLMEALGNPEAVTTVTEARAKLAAGKKEVSI